MSKINQIFSWAGLMSTVAIPVSIFMEWGDVSEAAEAFTQIAETAADSAVDFAKNADVVSDEMREIITTIDTTMPEGNVLEQGFEATFERARVLGQGYTNLTENDIQIAIKDVPFELTDSQNAALSESQLNAFKKLDKAELISNVISQPEFTYQEEYDNLRNSIIATEKANTEFYSDVFGSYGTAGLATGAAIGAVLPENTLNDAQHQGTQTQLTGRIV